MIVSKKSRVKAAKKQRAQKAVAKKRGLPAHLKKYQWTKKTNPHAAAPKMARAKPTKQKAAPMATKKKRKSSSSGKRKSRKGGRRRKGAGGSKWGLTSNQALGALAVAGAYGYIANAAEKSKSDEYGWFKDPPVLLTSVGRAGTFAAIAAGVAYTNIGNLRKYAKPVAYGLGAVMLLNLGRRGAKLYETEAEARGLLTAGHDGGGEGGRYRQQLSGTLDDDALPTARTSGYDTEAIERMAFERGRSAGYAEGQGAGFSAGAAAGAQAAVEVERAADSPH